MDETCVALRSAEHITPWSLLFCPMSPECHRQVTPDSLIGRSGWPRFPRRPISETASSSQACGDQEQACLEFPSRSCSYVSWPDAATQVPLRPRLRHQILHPLQPLSRHRRRLSLQDNWSWQGPSSTHASWTPPATRPAPLGGSRSAPPWDWWGYPSPKHNRGDQRRQRAILCRPSSR